MDANNSQKPISNLKLACLMPMNLSLAQIESKPSQKWAMNCRMFPQIGANHLRILKFVWIDIVDAKFS